MGQSRGSGGVCWRERGQGSVPAWPLAAPRRLGGEGACEDASSPLDWALQGEVCALILISHCCRLRPGRRQRFLCGLYSLFSECRVCISPVNCTRYSHLCQVVGALWPSERRMTRHMTYDPVTRVTVGKRSELLLLNYYEHPNVKLGFFSYIFPSLQLYLETDKITTSAV